MSKAATLGVDIGGTKIAFALVDSQGEVLVTHRAPTQAQDGVDVVIATLQQGITQVLTQAPQHDIKGVGVGCPGFVDPAHGVVRYAVNLNWHDVPLRERLREALAMDVPIVVDNDVNAAALGELRYGAGRDMQHLAYLAVGTGLGGAAVVNGRLLRGSLNFAMELGQVMNLPEWELEQPITLMEHLVSGTGLTKLAAHYRAAYPDSELLPPFRTQDILQAAEAGDALAMHALDVMSHWLGRVALWVTSILNPQLLVIGGGMGHAAQKWLLPALQKTLKQSASPPVQQVLKIRLSELQDPALGAAALLWDALEQ